METKIVNSSDINRADFYKKTFTHVAGAILAFAVIEYLLLLTVPFSWIQAMFATKFVWLFMIGGFWLLSILASKMTQAASKSTQYFGLFAYVIMEAVIFLPMIYATLSQSEEGILMQAIIITLALTAGLIMVGIKSGKDFSFLRGALIISGFIGLGLIVCGALFGLNLGTWFTALMLLVAGGSILYSTSNIKYNYSESQYVAASLELFSSIMLLFWYILRFFSSRD